MDGRGTAWRVALGAVAHAARELLRDRPGPEVVFWREPAGWEVVIAPGTASTSSASARC
ncbi:MAG: hypothetical protein AVDCRST_MAG49-2847 [uncultured Thermomicrobiales bacterium]|uniref:Uncharacterized protein n=1 Tax=uncultured Thermomicrobiales bacterium TaxID=1645740 RepID=A0A6J4UZG3_9BACT|nr:MAG: hypothetical protein AVDCRST_MAG49-2847 [uncultured Thermomicrobiales bacterium]